MWVDRILALFDEDDRSEQSLKLRGLQLFLQFHVSARLWFICFQREPDDPIYPFAMAGLATLAFALGLRPAWVRPALALSVSVMLWKLGVTFPMSSNHFMLELLNLLLLLALDPRSPDERSLLLVATRAITAIVIFHTGLQKIFYGTYFQGQFLAFSIATKTSFGDAFRLALPAEEYSRLVHSHPERFGAGPFVVRSPLFLLLSNGVYVFELLAPLLLLMRKTRTLATLAVIAFMAFVQYGARELFFGLLMVQLLLLFLPRAWNYRLLPLFMAIYAGLFLAHFWLIPEFTFY